ncbi:carbohydrate ABC transporter permease [Erysipelothrix urinaevulpis]|uniref:carbohydrate ABC transporter permease n=1 Tax=Erysipelothrix urinaevulpis TaxID=2683717 RepID=UPI00135A741F|nr:sugar ABC transporter permease [Erysipelothrix urinaevulpis]
MKKREWTYYLFIAPAVIAFLMVVAVPFFMGVFYSFTDWKGFASSGISFVGFTHYIESFKDPQYLYSIIVTFVFGFFNFVVVNVVSFGMALLVSSKIKGRNLYRTGFFVPNLIGGLVLGYIWQFMFNSVLPAFGEILQFSVLKDTFFLADPKLATIALVTTATWQYAGYIMMIYYTSLQGIPKGLVEASELDGASWLQKLRHIIVPMIAPAFTISLFLTLSNSFKQFDVIVSLTNGGPSAMFMGQAVKATELLSVNIYNTASIRNMMAQSQAKAVMFFIVLAIISFIQTSLTRRKEIEQ